jgi:hypothetical protein
MTPRTGPPQGLYLHTDYIKQNKHTRTYMPRVGFEPTIPAFERAMTVHALGRAATVIGNTLSRSTYLKCCNITNRLAVAATVSLNSINRLVFVAETSCVSSEIRTESLYIA